MEMSELNGYRSGIGFKLIVWHVENKGPQEMNLWPLFTPAGIYYAS